VTLPNTFLPPGGTLQHIVWQPTVENGAPVLDAHGNPTGTYAAPVTRNYIAWWPLERRTWEVDPIDPDVIARIENDIHMLVTDSTIYNKLDIVRINISTDPSNPDWLTYRVEGLPTHWAAALPFPTTAYGMFIGGEVHLRRVTSTGVLAGM
jgi:hypothetical protein